MQRIVNTTRKSSAEENNNVLKDTMGNLSGKCAEISEVCKNSEENNVTDDKKTVPDPDNDEEQEYNYASDEFENYVDDDDDDNDDAKKSVQRINSGRTSSKMTIETRRNEVKSGRNSKNQEIPKQPILFVPKKMSSSNASFSGSMGNQSRRINMSFTNERSREIHRENHILMQKLLKTKSAHSGRPCNTVVPSRESNSAIARRKNQEKTNYENSILLRKIQSAKSYNLSNRR